MDGDAELGRWEWEEQLNMLPSHTIQYFLMHTISMYYSTVLQYFNKYVIFFDPLYAAGAGVLGYQEQSVLVLM